MGVKLVLPLVMDALTALVPVTGVWQALKGVQLALLAAVPSTVEPVSLLTTLHVVGQTLPATMPETAATVHPLR